MLFKHSPQKLRIYFKDFQKVCLSKPFPPPKYANHNCPKLMVCPKTNEKLNMRLSKKKKFKKKITNLSHNSFWQKSEKKEEERKISFMPVIGVSGNEDHPDFRCGRSISHYSVSEEDKDPSEHIIHPLDKKSRWIYPICFIFYNSLYFSLLVTNQGLKAFWFFNES